MCAVNSSARKRGIGTDRASWIFGVPMPPQGASRRWNRRGIRRRDAALARPDQRVRGCIRDVVVQIGDESADGCQTRRAAVSGENDAPPVGSLGAQRKRTASCPAVSRPIPCPLMSNRPQRTRMTSTDQRRSCRPSGIHGRRGGVAPPDFRRGQIGATLEMAHRAHRAGG
jgi:hypothetical protein